MKDKVMVFAGTTEGRMIVEYLGSAGVQVHACVATEYGRTLIRKTDNVDISYRSLGLDGMRALMKDHRLVIDATHPYAVNVKKHIVEACSDTGAEYVRVVRPEGERCDTAVYVSDIESAVSYLSGTEGKVLVTTGSKDIAKYASLGKERIVARVLPNEDSIKKCADAGLESKNIVGMQGPFTLDMNLAMIRSFDVKYIVTKESGDPGGFSDKIAAAAIAGITPIVVGRPLEEEGLTLDETFDMLSERFGIEKPKSSGHGRRTLSVVGIGMGTPGGLTGCAAETVYAADLLVGARRMIESIGRTRCDILEEYASDRILDYLKSHTQYRNAVVLVSGDIGFYSAASKIITNADASEFDVRTYCGISSFVYLCGKLGIPWHDIAPVSAHGRDANIAGEVRRRERTFFLLHGSEGARHLCAELMHYGIASKVTIGQDLGMPEERIFSGTPEEVMAKVDSELCVALVDNLNPSSENQIYIPDEEFLRGDAPMTKSDVRALSVAKLKIHDDSVIYDVGAGTGSVSIEMARVAVRGKVYAIEKEEAAASLIEENKRRMCAPNVEVVRGSAPAAMAGLPNPTHAFIGGSSGNMKEILECLLSKNPSVRIVINAVTLETLSEANGCIEALKLVEEDIASISVAKGKRTGRYHLMTAQNPVYIITCRGPGV